MALNLEDEDAHRLAKELAGITGESLTKAVTEAIRERLKRVRQARGTGLAERLVAIGKDCAAHLKEPYRSVAHSKLLYGKKDLPRRLPTRRG